MVIIGQRRSLFFYPYEVCAAMQAHRIQIEHAADTADGEALAVRLPSAVATLVQHRTSLTGYRGALGGLQRG